MSKSPTTQIAEDLMALYKKDKQSLRIPRNSSYSRIPASSAAVSASASAATSKNSVKQATPTATRVSSVAATSVKSSTTFKSSASAKTTVSTSATAFTGALGAAASEMEQRILRSSYPIEISETEEISVHDQRGVWSNRAEVLSWRGDVNISEYQLHRDTNPLIMTKKAKQDVEYVQELAIRYLRPPTPPAPGEVVIIQEANIKTGPAPPLIIRQAAARAETPEPLVVREAPPEPPEPVGPKRITISGKRIPPPPRKVVIERFAPLPAKPQNVIIERWLPYEESKRRVIFNKAAEVRAEVVKPRNVIIQWETPKVTVKKEIKYLGVLKANPNEYVERYGSALKDYRSLPDFVTEIPTPGEVGTLAAEHQTKKLIDLEGELEAFQYVDLDSAGLSEYRPYLQVRGIRDIGATRNDASTSTSFSVKPRTSVNASTSTSFAARKSPASVHASTTTSAKFLSNGSASASSVSASDLASVLSSMSASGSGSQTSTSKTVVNVANAIFDMIDIDNSGYIDRNEADKIILRLNSRLRRSYGATEATAFFQEVSEGSDKIARAQFTSAIQRLA